MKIDNYNLFLFIFLLILLFYIIIINKICNSKESLNIYEYDSNISGTKIVIIGGTHGNEPSGSETIKELIKNLNNNKIKIKSGKLILIPEVNYCALRIGIRFIPLIGDLNRKYPFKKYKTTCPITLKIMDSIKDADFILDFHEGWGFHRVNKESMGSTITPTTTELSYILANNMLNKINKTIDDDKKKFSVFTDKKELLSNEYYSKGDDIKGSLRHYANLLNKNYILIETTGQNNIQPLEIRKSQCNLFITELLSHFNMI